MPSPEGPRKDLDREIFGGMVSLIGHHELSHIVRGHIDLLGLANLRATIHESASPQSMSSADARLRQWIELDADEWAAQFVTNEAFPSDLRASLSFEDIERRFRRFIFAAGLLFLLLEPHPQSARKAMLSSHPYIPTRLTRIAVVAMSFVEQSTNIESEILSQAMTSALEDLGRVYTTVGRDLIGQLIDDRQLIQNDLDEINAVCTPAQLRSGLESLRQRTTKQPGELERSDNPTRRQWRLKQ